ncbi:MAG: response regulator [Candidatus Aminicenantes bacterium]|nr:response regulator [Candidatus Aminicenantes bacterium]
MHPENKAINDKPLILLVDDIPMNVQILHRILSGGEYSYAVASSGEEALELVEKKKPDLILLDIMLGRGIDGFEVCKRLKGNPGTENIPIIFLTAKVELEDKVKGFELGAVDYITKPFENAEVIARVHTHIKLKKSTDMIMKYNRQLTDAIKTMEFTFLELEKSQNTALIKEKREAAKAMAVTANHEINQPLTLIRGYLELLSQSMEAIVLSEDQRLYFKRIEEALENILVILGKFRQAAAIEFGEYTSNVKMVVFGEKEKGKETGETAE